MLLVTTDVTVHFFCVVWIFGAHTCILLLQGKIATQSLSREVDEDKRRLRSDVLQKLEGSYAEAFNETFKLAIGVVGKLTDLGISTNGTKDSSEGNITLWKDILQSYVTNLKMDRVCDASEKLSTLVVCSFIFYTLCMVLCRSFCYTI